MSEERLRKRARREKRARLEAEKILEEKSPCCIIGQIKTGCNHQVCNQKWQQVQQVNRP